MESLLWALDLCAVVYLCMWALKSEKRREAEAAAQSAIQASEKDNHA
ncbi:hypothetical protein [Massilia suwonensis]|uniref:CcoQ/FixQ family Cbb3-type cytochrome c oxidase assembly chaperone n=1 Tax=Massilia suwonensis TaxID=648895 RepID=A0ABW0MHE6_9BURK